jgi:site-specific DNA-cytosine methylase
MATTAEAAAALASDITPEDFAGYECLLCQRRGALVVCSNAERYTCRACVCRACFRRWGWSWERYTSASVDVPFLCPRCLVSEPILSFETGMLEEEEEEASPRASEVSDTPTLREKLSMVQAFYACSRSPLFRSEDTYRNGRRRSGTKFGTTASETLSGVKRSPNRVCVWRRLDAAPVARYTSDGREFFCRLGDGTHSHHPLLWCSACPAAYHAPSCLSAAAAAAAAAATSVTTTSLTSDEQEQQNVATTPRTGVDADRQTFWLCPFCRRQRLPWWQNSSESAPGTVLQKRHRHQRVQQRLRQPAALLEALARYCRRTWPPRVFSGPRFVVLSLFDGLASARHALALLQIPPTLIRYYASEIDRDALAVAQSQYPDVLQLGPVEHLAAFDDIPEQIDLLIGGSPCTSLSGLGKRKGLYHGTSALFFEFLRIKRVMKPRFYLFENVASMRCADKRRIHQLLNASRLNKASTSADQRKNSVLVELDAARVTASLRRRLYVANFPLPATDAALPDWNLRLQDVLDRDGSIAESAKAFCITTNNMQGRPGDSRFNVIAMPEQGVRRGLRIHEAEKCLGFPAGYTAVLAKRSEGAMPRRWRLLGNAFAPPLIALLLRPLLEHSVIGAYLERAAVLPHLEAACREQLRGDRPEANTLVLVKVMLQRPSHAQLTGDDEGTVSCESRMRSVAGAQRTNSDTCLVRGSTR